MPQTLARARARRASSSLVEMIHTDAAVDNFYITAREAKDTPSRAHGVGEETEFVQRIYGASLIRASCVLLRLSLSVVVTAQTLLQRFYTKKSLRDYDVKLVVVAAIALACKLEGTDRKLRNVLNASRRAAQRHEGRPRSMLAINTAEFQELKSDAKNMELVMLREFGFFVHVLPPHPFAYTLGAQLELDKELVKRAWALCNDTSMTALCVRFKPAVIACGCIYLAARELGVALPTQPSWYRLVEGTSKRNLEVIAETILAFHAVDKIEYTDLSHRARGRGEGKRTDRGRHASRDRQDSKRQRDSSRDYGGRR